MISRAYPRAAHHPRDPSFPGTSVSATMRTRRRKAYSGFTIISAPEWQSIRRIGVERLENWKYFWGVREAKQARDASLSCYNKSKRVLVTNGVFSGEFAEKVQLRRIIPRRPLWESDTRVLRLRKFVEKTGLPRTTIARLFGVRVDWLRDLLQRSDRAYLPVSAALRLAELEKKPRRWCHLRKKRGYYENV